MSWATLAAIADLPPALTVAARAAMTEPRSPVSSAAPPDDEWALL